MSLFDEIRRVLEQGGRAVVLTVVAGEELGGKLLVREDGSTSGEGPADLADLAELAPAALRRGRSHVIEQESRTVFADLLGPPPRLFVYGAVDTAEALCRAAKLLGWTTIVADARPRFATAERFPSADELHVLWPEDALAAVQPDSATAVVILTHDDKFDLPMLTGTLATVVATRQSSPRPVGSKLAVSEKGELAGSVSGGCVESDVVLAAEEVLAGGPPRLLTYGITDEMAAGVGLPCGGEIDVFVEQLA